jgi:hypothetical protein
MLCESSSIQQSSPSLKSSSERTFCRLTRFDFLVVQSKPELLIYPGFWLLARRLSWLKVVCGPKSMPLIPLFWVLRCFLYNPVALSSSCPRTFATPTTCLWAFVLLGSRVQVRSGCWGSICFSLGVSWGTGAPGTLSMSWSLIDSFSMAVQVHLL